MANTITPIAQSLRERKKLKTREAIQREAMRLFQKQGYEETTIEQIAAAVEISPSTFFNYFPSKEDVVLYDAYDPIVASLFLARPADEPLSVSVRVVLNSMAGIFERDRDIILGRSKLIIREPALRAEVWKQLENARDLICGVIAQRYGLDPHDLDVRIVVMALLGGVMEATQEWALRDGTARMIDLINRALELVDLDAQLDALTAKK
jgi:AcrR family transcriptional regulator